MSRMNRTDVYPDFPYFTLEERERIDNFLKEMEDKHGSTSLPFCIIPNGSTEYSRYEEAAWKERLT